MTRLVALAVDRQRRRGWIDGAEVLAGPVEPGVWYHVPALFPRGETIVTADPVKLLRKVRRRIARDRAPRGRRGAIQVPLAVAS